MSRIARSDEALYQTRGDPVSWQVALTDDQGQAIDLTGQSGAAVLAWAGTAKALDVSAFDATGEFVVSSGAASTVDLPLGRVSELQLAVTDSLGAVTRYVWPVIGETP